GIGSGRGNLGCLVSAAVGVGAAWPGPNVYAVALAGAALETGKGKVTEQMAIVGVATLARQRTQRRVQAGVQPQAVVGALVAGQGAVRPQLPHVAGFGRVLVSI